MFRALRTPHLEEGPQKSTPLMQQRGRQAYLQRLGIQNMEKPGLDFAIQNMEKPALDQLDDSSLPRTPEGMVQNDFRQKFLQKLAYNRVWVPQAHRAPKHQTVIIFDWDDTLLCTSWLSEHDYQRDESDEDSVLKQIVQHAKKALELAIKTGHTYIITNAGSGWVEYSAARWVPELLPTLRKVQVISARDKFETAFPHDVKQWKIHAFLEVQRQLNATPITNLIALGDADYEIQAARIMGEEFEEGLVKTVKFRQHPNPEEHLKELELVVKNMEKIMGSVRNLKVVLERR